MRRLAVAVAVTMAAAAQTAHAADLPDLPTIAESGLPGYEFSSWYGLMVPAGTARQIVNRFHAEVVRILSQPDFRQRLSNDGSEPIGSTPEQFAAFLASEISKWEKVARSNGMRFE